MEIQVSTSLSNKQLFDTLKQQFSGRYSCELFGLPGQENIFISKSMVASVMVSSGQDKIKVVTSTRPSALSFLLTFFSVEVFYRSERKKIVQEVGSFLKDRYR